MNQARRALGERCLCGGDTGAKRSGRQARVGGWRAHLIRAEVVTWSLAAVVAASLLLTGACSSSASDRETKRRAEDEMEAGYAAARHGYWQEALLRFERANAMQPQQARILNNLAVALEAVGRYDEARATYERGLGIDPGDRNLKRNHTRFKEVYASLIAKDEEGDEAQSTEATTAEATEQPEKTPETSPEQAAESKPKQTPAGGSATEVDDAVDS